MDTTLTQSKTRVKFQDVSADILETSGTSGTSGTPETPGQVEVLQEVYPVQLAQPIRLNDIAEIGERNRVTLAVEWLVCDNRRFAALKTALDHPNETNRGAYRALVSSTKVLHRNFEDACREYGDLSNEEYTRKTITETIRTAYRVNTIVNMRKAQNK